MQVREERLPSINMKNKTGTLINETQFFPQVAERNTPRPMDVAGECLLYHDCMTRVYLADAKPEERSALRLLLLDLKMEVVGEAADWATTLADAPRSRLDMLLVEWDLLPINLGTQALVKLRAACPAALAIVIISHLDAHQQAALSASADAFINRGEMPERVAERLQTAAANIRIADVSEDAILREQLLANDSLGG
jgi:DNA-binding NarL/FixJ family response regulator